LAFFKLEVQLGNENPTCEKPAHQPKENTPGFLSRGIEDIFDVSGGGKKNKRKAILIQLVPEKSSKFAFRANRLNGAGIEKLPPMQKAKTKIFTLLI
jgi:hypothetical protein